MTQFPDAQRLAGMVSNVTNTMLGISFVADEHAAGAPAAPLKVFRTALLPIPGARPVTIGLSSDHQGCLVLSGAMFSVAANEVDSSMINDALCELVNMTAGLVKGALALDQALGLPRIVESGGEPTAAGQSLVLRAERVGLILWLQEGAVSGST